MFSRWSTGYQDGRLPLQAAVLLLLRLHSDVSFPHPVFRFSSFPLKNPVVTLAITCIAYLYQFYSFFLCPQIDKAPRIILTSHHHITFRHTATNYPYFTTPTITSHKSMLLLLTLMATFVFLVSNPDGVIAKYFCFRHFRAI